MSANLRPQYRIVRQNLDLPAPLFVATTVAECEAVTAVAVATVSVPSEAQDSSTYPTFVSLSPCVLTIVKASDIDVHLYSYLSM